MGIYVFTRDVLLESLERHAGVDFGHEIIPAALGSRRVNAYLFRDYWQDVGTVESFYDANIMLTRPRAPFNFYDPRRPVFTRPRFLPGSRLNDCTVDEALIAEGCYVDHSTITQSIVGIRTRIGRGCTHQPVGAARRGLLRERRRRPDVRRRRARDWASAPARCSTA